MKYFIFNKDMDYQRGICVNVSVSGGSLYIREPYKRLPGLFLSRVLDSGEQENKWHRLVMEAELKENTAVYLHIYATDSSMDLKWLDEWKKAFMAQADMAGKAGEKRLEELGRFLKLTYRNPKDILLHPVKARYLWFALILHGNGTGTPVVRRLRLDFPKESWMRFLPEVYQGEKGEFLERYLSVFQAVYDDMRENIRDNASYMDPQAAPADVLLWLSGWIGTRDSRLWNLERLRRFLGPGAAVYQRLGTAGYLERAVELYTGHTPYIREPKPEEDPLLFTLYISQEAVAGPGQYQALLRVIRESSPAHMEVRVIALKPYVFLNQDTYLGINSIINEYGQAVLDRGASIPYAVLGGREE